MSTIVFQLTNSGSVKDLFDALSRCSALHDSLLPSGEPSSFFGAFGDMADGPDLSDDELDGDDEDVDGDGQAGGEGEGGRVRSDFHSGGGPGARYTPY